MDSGNDRMQNRARRIGRGIEIYGDVEEICLDQFVVFQTSLIDGDLMTCSQGQTQSRYGFRTLRMADEVKQITIEDILSDYHREMLSAPAVKLYAAVWFRMGNRGVTEISMSDEEVSVRARVPMSGLSKVQSELAKMGLL
jgi:hypothetical protein